MRTFRNLSVVLASSFAILGGAGPARAVTLTAPGSFSQACFGSCLILTNTSAPDLSGGILATSAPGTGVEGRSTTGKGVVGRISDSGTAAVYGDAAFSGNAWAGLFDGDVNANRNWSNSYNLWSDARLKKDIEDAPYGLPQVLELRPVTFRWKKDGDAGETKLGLIAQEVRKVVPLVVSGRENSEMLSVDYIALVPVMIKAVQEQQRVIERQQAQIAKLEGGHSQLLSSMVPLGVGTLAAFGFLQIGFVLARRRGAKGRTDLA
jgi:hypothetical protein